MNTQLALGTVQFGQDYGISNRYGMPKIESVDSILTYAKQNNILTLDTAYTYGSSEHILGKLGAGNDFQIITKLRSAGNTSVSTDELYTDFLLSLERLQSTRVEGLMCHYAEDLKGHNKKSYINTLRECKERGITSKIGVCVYDVEDAVNLCREFSDLDIVQLPLNIIDQQAIKNENLYTLRDDGVEIHCRSIFLQGLLLMKAEERNKKFYNSDKHFEPIETFNKLNNMTALESCIRFIRQQDLVKKCIVGVNTLDELIQITELFHKDYSELLDYSRFSCIDPTIIKPYLWKT